MFSWLTFECPRLGLTSGTITLRGTSGGGALPNSTRVPRFEYRECRYYNQAGS